LTVSALNSGVKCRLFRFSIGTSSHASEVSTETGEAHSSAVTSTAGRLNKPACSSPISRRYGNGVTSYAAFHRSRVPGKGGSSRHRDERAIACEGEGRGRRVQSSWTESVTS
jgi:hypothetical protein